MSYILLLVAIVFTPLVFVSLFLMYVKRGRVKGHWLYSHYHWQIRTIWTCLLVAAVGLVLFLLTLNFAFNADVETGTFLPSVFGVAAFLVMTANALWYVYRCVFGLYRLHKGRPPKSDTL